MAIEEYIFEHTPVVKTGRKAARRLPSGKMDELIEITPHDPDQGSWKKWVRATELYRIE